MGTQPEKRYKKSLGIFLLFIAFDLYLFFRGLKESYPYFYGLGLGLVGTLLSGERTLHSYLTYRFLQGEKENKYRTRLLKKATEFLPEEGHLLEVTNYSKQWSRLAQEEGKGDRLEVLSLTGALEEGEEEGNLYILHPKEGEEPEKADLVFCNNLGHQVYKKGQGSLQKLSSYVKEGGQILLLEDREPGWKAKKEDLEKLELLGIQVLWDKKLRDLKLGTKKLRRRGLDYSYLSLYKKEF